MAPRIATSAAEAVAGIQDGATVLIGGFGNAGQPMELIDALMDCGATDLTVVNNNAGQADAGLAAADQGTPRQEGHLLLPAPVRLLALRRRPTAPGRSSWNWSRRATWPSASAPPAPASAGSSPPPATAPCSPRARKPA